MTTRAHRQARPAESDHDLLIRIDERVEKVERCLTNHLHRHWELKLAVIAAALTGLLSILTVLLTAVIRWGGK